MPNFPLHQNAHLHLQQLHKWFDVQTIMSMSPKQDIGKLFDFEKFAY